MSDRAVIDGRPVEVLPGDTILRASARAGIEIPTLCFSPGLAPEGGCRVCLVDAEGSARPLAACHAPLVAGMRITTSTPRIDALRREILALQLSAHAPGTFRPGEGEMGALLARCGVSDSPFGHHPRAAGGVDTSHPYLRFDAVRCITCRRCLDVCEEVQGQFVYGIEGRGGAVRLVFGPSERFVDGPCVACGACVEACPTGAITDRDRLDGRPAQRVTRSTCGYCGVGCRVEIESADGVVQRIRGVALAAVNHGQLCVKGRYAHAHHHSPDRLTTPLLRDGGELEPIPWPDAIAWVARRLLEIRDAHGPDALGVLTSSRSTNEAAYLLQKLFRKRLGTNNVDCCARVCHSSTALALRLATGTGAASASFDDIERARCIVVAGANPTEAHPVVGARIKQAVLRGATLVVVDPRRTELAEYAHVHVALRPGTNVAAFNAMAALLIAGGLIDRAYVEERLEGFDELAAFVARTPLDAAATTCGVEAAAIRGAARLLGAGPALFVSGLGLSELTQGTASVLALANLAMLTGSVGREGAGLLPLRGQNNVQGNADMGSAPDLVTGYQRLDDPVVRERLARTWGAAPPPAPGLTIPEMLDAAAAGRLKALWIQGEDVAQSDPHEARVLEGLRALDLLVVQEMFMTETARLAHLVLPAAGALEQDGTFTNAERRIQAVRAAVAAPGEARADWKVARDVGRALGEAWSYATPADVLAEIAAVAPALFGGVRWERLEPDGVQWPCPSVDHTGTAIVHAGGFLRGRGRLTVVEFQPSPEHAVPGFPYVLITGRVLDHYNVGTMTRRTPSAELVGEDVLEVHPDDAARDGVSDGEWTGVESRWGRATVRARHSPRMTRGALFLSFHFPETHANRLTGPQVDPDSKCPEYKVTAVRFVAPDVERDRAAHGDGAGGDGSERDDARRAEAGE